VNTGEATSIIHVTVLEMVALFPQPSVAVNVLTCVRVHPVDCIAPSFCVTVGVPQASVAVADPNAVVMAEDNGLHPKFCVA